MWQNLFQTIFSDDHSSLMWPYPCLYQVGPGPTLLPASLHSQGSVHKDPQPGGGDLTETEEVPGCCGSAEEFAGTEGLLSEAQRALV